MPENHKYFGLLTGLILLIFLAVSLILDLNAPWTRGHEGNAGLAYGSIARHWRDYGAFQMKFAQLRTVEMVPESDVFDETGALRANHLRATYGRYFWTSRLPVGALIQAAPLYVFPDQPVTLRWVPVLCAVLLILAVILLVRLGFGWKTGLLCGAALALNPATILISRQPGYEWPCLLLVTVVLLVYELFRQGKLPFWPVFTSAMAAGLVGWFGVYVVPVMLVESLIPRRAKRDESHPDPGPDWSQRAALFAIPFAVFGLYILYLHGLDHPLGERLQYFWSVRGAGGLAAEVEASNSVRLLEYLDTVQKHLFNHITAVPLLISAGWGVMCARNRMKGGRFPESRLVFMLLAFGLMCYLITFRAAFKHRFYVMWWLPFVAVSGGFFLIRLREHVRGRILTWVLLIALAASATYKSVRYWQKTRNDAPLTELHVRGTPTEIRQRLDEHAAWTIMAATR